MMPTDEDLAIAARQGDGAAFAQLATRHWSTVHRLARNLSVQVGDVQSMAEKVFLEALGPPEKGPSDRTFKMRLVRLAVMLSLGSAAHDAPGGTLEGTPGQDLEEHLRGVMRRLDGRDRASFVLRDIEELSLEETAAILAESQQTIQQRAHRARLIVMGCLGPFGDSPPSVVRKIRQAPLDI